LRRAEEEGAEASIYEQQDAERENLFDAYRAALRTRNRQKYGGIVGGFLNTVDAIGYGAIDVMQMEDEEFRSIPAQQMQSLSPKLSESISDYLRRGQGGQQQNITIKVESTLKTADGLDLPSEVDAIYLNDPQPRRRITGSQAQAMLDQGH
jgi:hypothetical protein